MPMERKRPRELSERFRYKFVERYDMKNNVLKIGLRSLHFVQIFLLLVCVKEGCFFPQLVVGGLLLCLAKVLSDVALKSQYWYCLGTASSL